MKTDDYYFQFEPRIYFIDTLFMRLKYVIKGTGKFSNLSLRYEFLKADKHSLTL